jgi:hypothetical protein
MHNRNQIGDRVGTEVKQNVEQFCLIFHLSFPYFHSLLKLGQCNTPHHTLTLTICQSKRPHIPEDKKTLQYSLCELESRHVSAEVRDTRVHSTVNHTLTEMIEYPLFNTLSLLVSFKSIIVYLT